MTFRLPQLALLIACALLACSLAGCGTVNRKLANSMADYVPEWAGGLPPDAPPRAGTPQYDAWKKKRERDRLLPADQHDQAQTPSSSLSSASGPPSSASPPTAGLDPIH
ncbi:MAG: hypothetical protein ACREDC_09450 [Bradyrhizobium sp.]